MFSDMKSDVVVPNFPNEEELYYSIAKRVKKLIGKKRSKEFKIKMRNIRLNYGKTK
jgi:hypothetical protein